MKNENIIVLGIDPGMNNTGWGVIEGKNMNFKHIANGCIISDKKWKVEKKLENIFYNLEKIIEEFKPMYGAVEKVFVNINAQSSLKLGQVRGVILLGLARGKVPIGEYSPNQIKKSLSGYGHASKDQILKMLSHIFPEVKIFNDDSGDALAIAICHLMNIKFLNEKDLY